MLVTAQAGCEKAFRSLLASPASDARFVLSKPRIQHTPLCSFRPIACQGRAVICRPPTSLQCRFRVWSVSRSAGGWGGRGKLGRVWGSGGRHFGQAASCILSTAVDSATNVSTMCPQATLAAGSAPHLTRACRFSLHLCASSHPSRRRRQPTANEVYDRRNARPIYDPMNDCWNVNVKDIGRERCRRGTPFRGAQQAAPSVRCWSTGRAAL